VFWMTVKNSFQYLLPWFQFQLSSSGNTQCPDNRQEVPRLLRHVGVISVSRCTIDMECLAPLCSNLLVSASGVQ
jgi:hypothetical protein